MSEARMTRTTRQGELVRDQLEAADGFRSAQAIFADLRAQGASVGLSTVYRHLQVLSDSGEADTLQTAEGEVLYRLCGAAKTHHHHLVCRRCGRTAEIEGRAVERWTEAVAAEHGFSDVDHVVELIGLCAECGNRGERGS